MSKVIVFLARNSLGIDIAEINRIERVNPCGLKIYSVNYSMADILEFETDEQLEAYLQECYATNIMLHACDRNTDPLRLKFFISFVTLLVKFRREFFP
ncbi:hypothetical protein, partial [Caedibacter taeniospiralis]|uniref:hypothetical protein n=1 Tax=Caedibacter taeniospiralis TaxID=28907 RepID=UPI0037BFF7F3